jgi:hypothetical protein
MPASTGGDDSPCNDDYSENRSFNYQSCDPNNTNLHYYDHQEYDSSSTDLHYDHQEYDSSSTDLHYDHQEYDSSSTDSHCHYRQH